MKDANTQEIHKKSLSTPEVREYRLSALEQKEKQYHEELLAKVEHLEEKTVQETSQLRIDVMNKLSSLQEQQQTGYNQLHSESIQMDMRISYLEKKFQIQEKYLYGVIITVISQVLIDLLHLIR